MRPVEKYRLYDCRTHLLSPPTVRRSKCRLYLKPATEGADPRTVPAADSRRSGSRYCRPYAARTAGHKPSPALRPCRSETARSADESSTGEAGSPAIPDHVLSKCRPFSLAGNRHIAARLQVMTGTVCRSYMYGCRRHTPAYDRDHHIFPMNVLPVRIGNLSFSF
jgi:hypothetical protein